MSTMHNNEPSTMRTAKRREQSRSAAKSRRLTESEVYTELADALPNIDRQTIYQSDRIGLLRLACMVCKTRKLMAKLFPVKSENVQNRLDKNYFDEITVAQCINGFVLIINKAGQLLYISGGVSSSIGFTQIDLAGKYLRDYVHNEDWQTLSQQLHIGTETWTFNSPKNEISNSKFFFRMKTAMTPRGGRARKLTMAVYQPMLAYEIDLNEKLTRIAHETGSTSIDEDIRIIYCIPFALSPLQKGSSWMSASDVTCTRHEVDMRFRFCSDKLTAALQYGNPKKLAGQSFYDFVYPEDLPRLVKEFRLLYKDGHIVTSYYRLSTNSGGCVWTMTEAALLTQNIRGVTQKSIICNHHILGGIDISTLRNAQFTKLEPVSVRDSVVMGRNSATPPAIAVSRPELSKEFVHVSPISSTLASAADTSSCTSARLPIATDGYLRSLVGLRELPELNPYIAPNLVDKYGLLYLGTSTTQPSLEFSSILMAAMGVSSSAKLLSSAKPYLFPPISMFGLDGPSIGSSIINAPTDLSRVLLNSNTASLANSCIPWTPAYAGAFKPFVSHPGILTSGLRPESPKADEVGRRHRLDAKTIESFEVAIIKNELTGLQSSNKDTKKDEAERRHELDTKTVESFEVSIIQNDLAVAN